MSQCLLSVVAQSITAHDPSLQAFATSPHKVLYIPSNLQLTLSSNSSTPNDSYCCRSGVHVVLGPEFEPDGFGNNKELDGVARLVQTSAGHEWCFAGVPDDHQDDGSDGIWNLTLRVGSSLMIRVLPHPNPTEMACVWLLMLCDTNDHNPGFPSDIFLSCRKAKCHFPHHQTHVKKLPFFITNLI